MTAQSLDNWTSGLRGGRHLMSEQAARALDAQFSPKIEIAAGKPLGIVDTAVLNVRPDPIDFRDRIYEPGLVEIGTILPPPDMAKMGLAVRAQGSEGSCTGQALAAVVDLQNIIRRHAGADVPERVSARMLYEQARLFDEYADDRLPGSSARGAIKGFYHHGVCSSVVVPYIDGDVSYKLTAPIAKDAKKVTLGAYFRLRHFLNHYHAALSEAKAIYCTAMIHNGWSAAEVSRNQGRIRLPKAGVAAAQLIGAHAFAIVGYDCDGFIVLNSWGTRWGAFDFSAKAHPRPQPGEAAPVGQLPGMAHWSFEDWSAHVLDAWVLRLQAPAGLPSGYAGGYRTAAKQDLQPGFGLFRASEPNLKIVGNYIHVKDGRYCGEPPYASSAEAIEETIRHLTDESDKGGAGKYDHVLFYAHGGINSLDAAIARTAAMSDGFKRNRVWPIFYLWRTGLGEVAEDLIGRVWERVSGRAAGPGLQDLTDTLIEGAARPLVTPFWREMKTDAFLCSDVSTEKAGDAWRATRRIIEAVAAGANAKTVHFVGHSAGATFLAHMFDRARQDGVSFAKRVGTVSLFAPACDVSTFTTMLKPVAPDLVAKREPFAVYNLTDTAERDDNVVDLYRKSLLYLVSNALEGRPETPIAGMDKFIRGHEEGIAYHLAGSTDRDGKPIPLPRQVSRSSSHGGFDNDPLTMNHVLARVIGAAGPSALKCGFNSAELSGDLF
ncbi:alpha/beta hydrolase [Rhizobium sp. BK251]|uniref:alpha/beta hydrolase n=1 Tax=Rhizobium sp. BK251 TaxID=2512125 RepID=UPI00104A5530|nr:alpha/beta hydrolase [Rhizobium sp. BK251]TCL75694.1 alpha/beta hydrolase family protein [Rhizobium sp. BK251]